MQSTRLISSALLLSETIKAAKDEGLDELATDLIKAQKYQIWREHNQRIEDAARESNPDLD